MVQPSIKKNYFYRLFYEILNIIVPFITTPYVSRILQADGIGVYSYTNSIVAYFTLFAALGTLSYGTREIAQHRDDKIEYSRLFWEIELMTVITSSICLLAWVGLIVVSVDYKYYFLALTPMIIATMVDISWFYMGHELMKYIVIRNTVCKILGLVLLFVLVKQKDDLLTYIVINTGVQLLGNLSMWTYLPRLLVKIDFKTLKIGRHFKETLVYFVPTIATSIYTILDKTLIGLITKDSFQNGYYEQATKIISIVKSVSFSSVNAVMSARISYLFSEKRFDEIRVRIMRSMDFILLLGFGCIFGICGIANRFVPMFFGEGYSPVVYLLYLMSPLVVIIGVSNCLGSQYYTPSGKRKESAKFIITGSIINLALNCILIPYLSAAGATIASIIAEITISFLYIKSSNAFMTFGKIFELSWKRIASGLAMLIVLLIIGKAFELNSVWALIVQIVVGIITYFTMLIILQDSMVKELISTAKGYFKRIHKFTKV